MRLYSIIIAALLLFSCQKINSPLQEFKPITDNISPGRDIHEPIVIQYNSNYGYSYTPIINKDQMIVICNRLKPIVEDVTGRDFPNYTSTVISIMTEAGLFDDNNNLKTGVDWKNTVISNEPDLDFRLGLTNIYEYEGDEFINFAQEQLILSNRTSLYLDVLEHSYLGLQQREPLQPMQGVDYWMWRHQEIARADADGSSRGYWDATKKGMNHQMATVQAVAVGAAYSIARWQQLNK